jgi:hypothetical protein
VRTSSEVQCDSDWESLVCKLDFTIPPETMFIDKIEMSSFVSISLTYLTDKQHNIG